MIGGNIRFIFSEFYSSIFRDFFISIVKTATTRKMKKGFNCYYIAGLKKKINLILTFFTHSTIHLTNSITTTTSTKRDVKCLYMYLKKELNYFIF